MLQFSPPYKNFVPKFQYFYCVSTSVALSLCGASISYRLIEVSVSIGVIPTISIGTISRCLSRSLVSRFSLSSVSSDLISTCNYMPNAIMHAGIFLRSYPCSDTKLQRRYQSIPKTTLYSQEHLPALIPSCRAPTRILLTVAPNRGTRTVFKTFS